MGALFRVAPICFGGDIDVIKVWFLSFSLVEILCFRSLLRPCLQRRRDMKASVATTEPLGSQRSALAEKCSSKLGILLASSSLLAARYSEKDKKCSSKLGILLAYSYLCTLIGLLGHDDRI